MTVRVDFEGGICFCPILKKKKKKNLSRFGLDQVLKLWVSDT